MSQQSEDSGCIGGVLFLIFIVGFISTKAYDHVVGKSVLESHTIVASAVDARNSRGKAHQIYQVEVLITRDDLGYFHKIDCPLEFWVVAKPGERVDVQHWDGPVFQKYELRH